MKLSIIDPTVSEEQSLYPDFERMKLAISSLNAGTWTVDISTNSLIVCTRCKEIIPICNEGIVKVSLLRDLIAPGYEKKVVDAFSLALKTESPFNVEVPIIVVKDSCPRWLRVTGTPTPGRKDSPPVFHGTVEDISERKNGELLKQDVLAMVSHDLRSPLSVIKLYVQLCGHLAGNIGNNCISGMLKKAELQVHKMNRMIQCYLESSAMEAGKISHFPVAFDIQELLKEVIGDVRLLYPGHILFHKPGPCLQVYADRDKIAQVLQNLLSNAIKYSSRIDVITVHSAKVGNCLQVTVEDHGTGIKAIDHEKVFDRFYRVDDESGTTVKGYGIGLYLSREIIKQHNGEIWLKSEVNKGSKFYFTLPLSSTTIL